MTNTTPINVNTELYNKAQQYAKEHNTSVDKMMENYILTILMQTAIQPGNSAGRGKEYQNMIGRLSDFEAYEPGWDGDDARPLNRNVSKNMRQVLEKSEDTQLSGWTIFPAANGSLLLEYKPREAGINIGKDDFSYYCLTEEKVCGKNHLPFSPEAVIETMNLIANDRK